MRVSHKGDHVKKLAFLGAAAGLGMGALLIAHTGHAADHLDAPAASANHMADITDVYAWMNTMHSKVNLIMDVSPAEDGSHHFGPSVQYVFHVMSHPGSSVATAFGSTGTETKIICTFASDTSIQCWVVGHDGSTLDYVMGDPSNPAGLTSPDGKVRVYAGLRSDPFFFNFNGFVDAVAAVDGAEGSDGSGLDQTLDAHGCPQLGANAAPIAAYLSETTGSGSGAHLGSAMDPFASFNVQAIVLQVDNSLLNQGSNFLLSVWGSTHAGS